MRSTEKLKDFVWVVCRRQNEESTTSSALWKYLNAS